MDRKDYRNVVGNAITGAAGAPKGRKARGAPRTPGDARSFRPGCLWGGLLLSSLVLHLITVSSAKSEGWMFFDNLFGMASNDVASDLGTADARVDARGRGIVIDEPSVVAVQRDARGSARVL